MKKFTKAKERSVMFKCVDSVIVFFQMKCAKKNPEKTAVLYSK